MFAPGALALAVWAAPAGAQNLSDLQPATPAGGGAASGGPGGGYWIPGAPMPVLGGNSGIVTGPAGGANRTGPAAAGGDAKAGRAAPVFGETGEAIDEGMRIETASRGGGVPETHLVQKGDTLWDISNQYFRNPWNWPRLWALNPLVTNPHWIYPGDVLRLRAPGEEPPAPAETPAPGAPIERRITSNSAAMRQTGFVETGELKASAKIIGSREERMLLTVLDEVYVEYNKDRPLQAGERYSIYRVVSDVKHPGSRKLVGAIVEIVGDVEIKRLADKRIAQGVITEAADPIERGFRVGPLRRAYEVGTPTPSAKDLKAMVVAAVRPYRMVDERMVVFLDRGRDDGVEPGNRFLVIRRGDYAADTPLVGTRSDDDRFPREVFGEVQVVEVRKNTCVAVVLRSTQELVVGDRLEARKGY